MTQSSDYSSIQGLFDGQSQSEENQKFSKIQGRKFIIIYDSYIDDSQEELCSRLQTIFQDNDLRILEFHWSSDKEIILISLSKKRKLSFRKWINKLTINGHTPRIITFQKDHLDKLSQNLDNHFPQRKEEKLMKLMNKQIKPKEFLKSNPRQFYSYPQIKRSLEIMQAQEMEQELKRNRYKKRRGIYLYGPAGSGKTTIAIKKFLDQSFYQKAMNTTTYDAYYYQKSILYDEMNPKNSKLHLDQLKNVVNILPAAVNVKFGSKIINPEKIVITSQYYIHQLTKDPELLAAFSKRFRFYAVSRQDHITKLTQFNREESDQSGIQEYEFTTQQLGFQVKKINQVRKEQNTFNTLISNLKIQCQYLKNQMPSSSSDQSDYGDDSSSQRDQ